MSWTNLTVLQILDICTACPEQISQFSKYSISAQHVLNKSHSSLNTRYLKLFAGPAMQFLSRPFDLFAIVKNLQTLSVIMVERHTHTHLYQHHITTNKTSTSTPRWSSPLPPANDWNNSTPLSPPPRHTHLHEIKRMKEYVVYFCGLGHQTWHRFTTFL